MARRTRPSSRPRSTTVKEEVVPSRTTSSARRSACSPSPTPTKLEPAGLGERAQRLGAGVVDAGDQEAVGVDGGHELGEGGAVGLLGAPGVEVVGPDVGDDRGVRAVDQEGAVALVGLGDEEVAGPGVGVAAGRRQHPADGVRRVGAAGEQGDGEQRGGGGLAVRAGHGQHPAVGHHRGEPGRARQQPQPAAARLEHLGVVLAGGGGDHDGVAGPEVAEVGGVVAEVAGDAELAQRGQERGVLVVAAGDRRRRGRP